MSAHVEGLAAEAARYVAETRRLSEIGSTTEETFYPAVRDLLSAVLRAHNLPFQVRTGTSESKESGPDRPDFILADSGLFVGVFGEIKTPDATLEDIAVDGLDGEAVDHVEDVGGERSQMLDIHANSLLPLSGEVSQRASITHLPATFPHFFQSPRELDRCLQNGYSRSLSAWLFKVRYIRTR